MALNQGDLLIKLIVQDINSVDFIDEYDKEIFILKVEQFIENHIEGNLGLGNELHNFIGAIFRKLTLPPFKLETHIKPSKLVGRIIKS